MKKSLLNGSWIAAAAAVMALAGASTARADEIVAKVPFNFIAGKMHFRAGEYVVKTAPDNPDIVSVQGTDGRQSLFILTIPTNDRLEQPHLVFTKVGNQYFLARIGDESGTGREIVMSRDMMEREAADAAVNP